MKRKVIQLAKKTLIVSLPKKWVTDNDVRKGDELNTFPEKGQIIFSKGDKHKDIKEITLDIDKIAYHSLSRYLTVLYRTNYNKIILTYSKNTILNEKKGTEIPLKNIIKKLVDRFIGSEIISQTATRTVIECFTADQRQDLEKVEKRIYYLFKETINEMLAAIGKGYNEFHETTYNHHDNITKFINFYLRELQYSEWSEEKKRLAFGFYMLMDKMIDKMRHLSEKIDEHGCTDKVKKVIKDVFELFFEQYTFINKKVIPQEVVKKRYAIVNKIKAEKFSVKEMQVMKELDLFLNVMNDFSEYAIAKGVE